MAISPTVNAWMQQDESPARSAEQLFIQQFGSQAFNMLRAKFPALVNHVVTFKTLSSDVDKAEAFGVFLVEKGRGLVYIPVTLAGGIITSCEMVYNKEADQFSPLSANEVKEISGANKFSDPRVLTDNPRVDDTRALFRNMVRPPMSSNVVLAGSRASLDSLPDKHKALLAAYLEHDNPHLLGKIAGFYPVEDLAHKLRPTPQKHSKQANAAKPAVLTLDTLDKDTVLSLSPQEREDMLREGYVVKSAQEGGALHVAPVDSLTTLPEQELLLETYSGQSDTPVVGGVQVTSPSPAPVRHKPVRAADVVQTLSAGLVFEPVLLCGNDIFGREAYRVLGFNETALVREVRERIPAEYFKKFPCMFPLGEVRQRLNAVPAKDYLHLHIFVPARNGGWMFLDTNNWLYGLRSHFQVESRDGELHISEQNRPPKTLTVTPAIRKGYMLSDSGVLVPETSWGMLGGDAGYPKGLTCVDSLDSLRKLMGCLGTRLRVVDQQPGLGITDKSSNKTASFGSRAQAASWLVGTYGLNAQQVRTVLDSRESVVFKKEAFFAAPAPQQNPMPQGSEESPVQSFDPQALDSFADLEDPELMDTGILSSFAQDPDIRGLLVDYLPDFLASQDKLGRLLLLFSSRKKELEDFYGSEKYGTLVGSCRKVFGTVGDLVASLKTYINMA